MAVPNAQKAPAGGLLILHPGALGDVVATFPAILELGQRFRPVSLLCQGHIAALAARLGVIDVPLALESAVFAGLYGDEAPPSRMRKRLSPCRHVLVFSRSPQLTANLRGCLPGATLHTATPRPPAHLQTHVLGHLYDQLTACGLLPPASRSAPARGLFGPNAPAPANPGGERTVLLHPGAGSSLHSFT